MIAGLPATAWLLIVVSVGLGLSIELVFFFDYRRRRRLSTGPSGYADESDKGQHRPPGPGAPG